MTPVVVGPADCVVTEVSDTRPWSSTLGTAPRQRCSIGGSGLSVLGAEPEGGYAGERNRVSVADNERRQTFSDARWPRAQAADVGMMPVRSVCALFDVSRG